MPINGQNHRHLSRRVPRSNYFENVSTIDSRIKDLERMHDSKLYSSKLGSSNGRSKIDQAESTTAEESTRPKKIALKLKRKVDGVKNNLNHGYQGHDSIYEVQNLKPRLQKADMPQESRNWFA